MKNTRPKTNPDPYAFWDSGPDKQLEDLEKALAVDENELELALKVQPDAFYRVSKRWALLVSQRDAAKHTLAHVEAETDARVRQDLEAEDEKVTEPQVKARIATQPAVVSATVRVLELNRQVSLYTALKEAFQQRSYVLKDLVALYTANYFGASPDMRTNERLRNDRADRNRADMARQRRDRS